MKKIHYDMQGIIPKRYMHFAYSKGWTDEKASLKLGLSHGCMHHWKRKGVKPSADSVVRMMKVMGVKERDYA